MSCWSRWWRPRRRHQRRERRPENARGPDTPIWSDLAPGRTTPRRKGTNPEGLPIVTDAMKCVERWRTASRKRRRSTSPHTSRATDCDKTRTPYLVHEKRGRRQHNHRSNWSDVDDTARTPRFHGGAIQEREQPTPPGNRRDTPRLYVKWIIYTYTYIYIYIYIYISIDLPAR